MCFIAEPFDERMGITKHQHISYQVQRLSLEMTARMPFRMASEIIERVTPVTFSRQTIGRIVERVAGIPALADSHASRPWVKSFKIYYRRAIE